MLTREEKIRVLIADDSPTSRQLLHEILLLDPTLAVVGFARNGKEAVAMNLSLRPDVVAMDLRMPGMDGLAATNEIMTTQPTPIVIVSSAASPRPNEARQALDALRAGALAILEKPVGPENPDFEAGAKRIIDTLKAMAGTKLVRRWGKTASRHSIFLHHASPCPTPQSGVGPPPAGGPVSHAFPLKRMPSGGRCLVMAASTGGPIALQTILSSLPRAFPLPVLVVQHIAKGFGPQFASWLGSFCNLRVKLAEPGERLLPGTVYFAPEDRHLGVTSGPFFSAEISAAPPVMGFRPSASHLFRSASHAFGDGTIAVILTGMGNDGLTGLKEVRASGGIIIAQNEATSVVFGMPQAAIQAGLADLVLPLDEIATHINGITAESPREDNEAAP